MAGIHVTLLSLSHHGALPLSRIREHDPHIVLLAGIPSPWESISLAESLRHDPVRPGILFLTSAAWPASTLWLADDYTSETDRPADIALRVKVLRARRSAPAADPVTSPAAGLQLLPESRRVVLHGRESYLTATEFDLLRLLTAKAGRVVTKQEILELVWRHDFDGKSSVVETYIHRLRRKLQDRHRTLIINVHGIGYRLKTGV